MRAKTAATRTMNLIADPLMRMFQQWELGPNAVALRYRSEFIACGFAGATAVTLCLTTDPLNGLGET